MGVSLHGPVHSPSARRQKTPEPSKYFTRKGKVIPMPLEVLSARPMNCLGRRVVDVLVLLGAGHGWVHRVIGTTRGFSVLSLVGSRSSGFLN